MKTRLLAVVLFAFAVPAWACLHSPTQREKFKRANPCPITGRASGACPGWIVDHVIPLCAGGRDAPSNMQWQTVADAKAKDKLERVQCAKHHA